MFLDNSKTGSGLNFFYTGRQAAGAAGDYYDQASQMEDSNVVDRSMNFGIARAGLFAARKSLGQDTGGGFFKSMVPQSTRNWKFGQNKMSGMGKLGLGYLAFGYDDLGDVGANAALFVGLTALERPGVRNFGRNLMKDAGNVSPTIQKQLDIRERAAKIRKPISKTPEINNWHKKYGITNLGKEHKQFRKKHASARYINNRKKNITNLNKASNYHKGLVEKAKINKYRVFIDRRKYYNSAQEFENIYIKPIDESITQHNKARSNIRYERISNEKQLNKLNNVASRTKEVRQLGKERYFAWGGKTTTQKVISGAGKLAGKAGLVAGAGLAATALFAPVAKHMYESYNRGLDQIRDGQNLDFGTGAVQLSGQAMNERQRALEAISNANFSARNYMGSESLSYH